MGGGDSRPASALNRLNANASQPRPISQGGPSSSTSTSTPARPKSSLNVPPGSTSSSLSPSYYNTSTIKPSTPTPTPTLNLNNASSPAVRNTPTTPYATYESNAILEILSVTHEVVESEFPDKPKGTVGKDEADTLLIAKLSVEGDEAGLTTFEYLTGCWKRLYRVHRETLRAVSVSFSERAFSGQAGLTGVRCTCLRITRDTRNRR